VEILMLLAILLCPIVMGGMMVWMMRRMGTGTSGAEPGQRKDPE
jgi:hypothetical protein